MSDQVAALGVHGSGVLYKNLKPGEQFRFPHSDVVLVKSKRGHKDPGGKSWVSGPRAAVILLNPQQ